MTRTIKPGGLHRKLFKAASLSGALPAGSKTLADMGAQFQRVLGRLGVSEQPGRSSVGASEVLADPLKLMERLNLPMPQGSRRSGAAAPSSGGRMIARDFESRAGRRPYKLYVPGKPAERAPLLVMLHGCTQSAEDFAAGTRMNTLAESHGFLVLYPEQISQANAQRCWNWFNPADQQRDGGEADIIGGMTRAVRDEFGADPKRVFVAGLSAGGAQAAILGAAYPDLYAAIGVHSGLACGAAHDMMSAFSAMQQGRTGQGMLTLPAILFHGDRDNTVNPRNADAVAAQVAPGPERVEEGQVPGGFGYTRKLRLDDSGRPLLEQWTVHKAGHAWSGGSSAGSFTEPRGPDASKEMLRFFLSVR
jgi:poly(hydroxyalkanoate) depolymerase family esterase